MLLRFFNSSHVSALTVGLIILSLSFVVSYHFGSFAWLPLDAAVLPIGGRLLSQIPVWVGYPLSYGLLFIGSTLVRQLLLRYISGITHSHLIVFLLPLLVGGLGLGAHNLLPPLVALLLLALALAMILSTLHAVQVLSRIFIISVLIGISSFFYLPALFFSFAPLFVLLNRNVMGLRGILLIIVGVALPASFLLFICWLLGTEPYPYYPLPSLWDLSPSTLLAGSRWNPIRPLYMIGIFLLWIPTLWHVRNPHKVHRTNYFLVRNILFWDFIIAFLSIFLVRDPFYMLPITFSLFSIIVCYTFPYTSGWLSNILFTLILCSGIALHFL